MAELWIKDIVARQTDKFYSILSDRPIELDEWKTEVDDMMNSHMVDPGRLSGRRADLIDDEDEWVIHAKYADIIYQHCIEF